MVVEFYFKKYRITLGLNTNYQIKQIMSAGVPTSTAHKIYLK